MWVVACLSKKYACGSRDMEVFDYLSNKSEEKILNSTNKKILNNKIKLE